MDEHAPPTAGEGTERPVEVDESDSMPDAGGALDVRSLVRGAIAGFVATVVMTSFRIPISKSLPPTANFWAKFVGNGEPDDYPIVGAILHVVYGIGGGVVFAILFPTTGIDIVDERRGAVAGTIYGFFLSVFGIRVVLGRLLDMELDADEQFVFHVSHLVYGVTLGTWLGSTAKDEEPARYED